MTTTTTTPHPTVVRSIPPAPERYWGVLLPLLAMLLVAVALFTRGTNDSYVGYTAVPAGGVNVTRGDVTVDDAWVDAPHGVTAQADTPLRLTLVDTTHAPNLSLTGVTSPEIKGAALRQLGRTVHAIRVPADGNPVNLEWSGPSGITLLGLRHPLPAGAYLPITLHYSDGTSQALQVGAGPLGGISAQQPT